MDGKSRIPWEGGGGGGRDISCRIALDAVSDVDNGQSFGGFGVVDVICD